MELDSADDESIRFGGDRTIRFRLGGDWRIDYTCVRRGFIYPVLKSVVEPCLLIIATSAVPSETTSESEEYNDREQEEQGEKLRQLAFFRSLSVLETGVWMTKTRYLINVCM